MISSQYKIILIEICQINNLKLGEFPKKDLCKLLAPHLASSVVFWQQKKALRFISNDRFLNLLEKYSIRPNVLLLCSDIAVLPLSLIVGNHSSILHVHPACNDWRNNFFNIKNLN